MDDAVLLHVRREFEKATEWGQELIEKPTKTPYFYNMVVSLLDAMLKQQHHLTIGYQKSPLLLAWGCRNL